MPVAHLRNQRRLTQRFSVDPIRFALRPGIIQDSPPALPLPSQRLTTAVTVLLESLSIRTPSIRRQKPPTGTKSNPIRRRVYTRTGGVRFLYDSQRTRH